MVEGAILTDEDNDVFDRRLCVDVLAVLPRLSRVSTQSPNLTAEQRRQGGCSDETSAGLLHKYLPP
jgi:hypothetical protein